MAEAGSISIKVVPDIEPLLEVVKALSNALNDIADTAYKLVDKLERLAEDA